MENRHLRLPFTHFRAAILGPHGLFVLKMIAGRVANTSRGETRTCVFAFSPRDFYLKFTHSPTIREDGNWRCATAGMTVEFRGA
jgi:hypothetical protein